jgi:alpha-beta hydrolase superfamily lysophospholipase
LAAFYKGLSMEKKKSGFSVPVYLKWIGWVLLVQFILINISASFYAYKLTHVNDDPSLRNAAPSRNIIKKTWRLFTGPRQARSVITETPTFPYDTIQLKTAKGLLIDTWYCRADSASRGTVILFHGITANKSMVLAEAGEFRFLGYDVMLVDFRAHGNSEGNTTTMGIRETEEVKLSFDYAASLKPKQIFLWGNSMGAVVVAKAVADHGLKPAGLILEMPFGSMQSHLQARARALGFQGFPEKPFGFFVSWWIGIERGLKSFKHKTATYAAKLDCPVLMQWGARDMYVLRSETDKIFEAIASPKKKLVVYKDARHESLLMNDRVKWRKEIEGFLGN